jgi:hypothetical protein
VALYRHAEVHAPPERAPVNVLFVVPTQRRLRALADALAADDERRSKIRGYRFESKWPPAAVLQAELAAGGPLAPVWQSLAGSTDRGRLCDLPARTELAPIELARCLGRRWRKERPGFWQALSPLGAAPGPAASEKPLQQPALEPEPEAVGIALAPPTPIERMREQLLAEARRDLDAASGRDRGPR